MSHHIARSDAASSNSYDPTVRVPSPSSPHPCTKLCAPNRDTILAHHVTSHTQSTMQKKPGKISSNTLSLRFMQNAAKTRQEREIEAAKAKVHTNEEWELAPEYRERCSMQQDEGQR